jgi:16S rRNA processing protein RimM
LSEISLSDSILVGKVVRPHGREGLVRVLSYARSEASFMGSGMVFLKKPSGEVRGFQVLDVRPHKRVLLMRLEGVDSIQSAEDIRGADIFVGAHTLSKAEDEAFWFELLGLTVYLESGESIGKVFEILPTPAHEIYVVRDGSREYLIPGVHEVVKEIDVRKGRMVIRPPEGLLEMNDI